jgi:hypothetical protein
MDENEVEDKEERDKTLFESLVYTLNMTAMQRMGKVDDPLKKTREVDLESARDTLDIIIGLKEKTKGNISEEESRFLDKIIDNVTKYFNEAVAMNNPDVQINQVELPEY